jgi:hypothetical protein
MSLRVSHEEGAATVVMTGYEKKQSTNLSKSSMDVGPFLKIHPNQSLGAKLGGLRSMLVLTGKAGYILRT